MAESAIAGLFQTPEMYELAREQQARREALEYAQLTPQQQIMFDAARAGQGIGRGLGQLFGVEDPQLKMISQRNALARQFDLNTPQGLMQYSDALRQGGDLQASAAVADRARAINAALIEQGSKAATTQETLAKTAGLSQTQRANQATISQLQQQYGLDETQATAIANNPDLVKSYFTPASSRAMELLKTGDFTPGSVAKWVASGGLDASILERLDKTHKPSADWLAVARELGLEARPTYNDYTPEQAASVNRILLQNDLRKKAAGAPNMPGQDKLVTIPQFRQVVINSIEKPRNTVIAVDSALDSIENALATGNFASFRAAQTQFAKAISGTGDLSKRELEAAGGDPSLVGGMQDYLSTLATATPSIDTQRKMRSALLVVRNAAVNKANAELTRQRAIALSNPNYKPEDIERALTFDEFKPRGVTPAAGGGKTRTLSSGKVVTVID